MKKTFYFLIAILVVSCINTTDSQKKASSASKLALESLEIQYAVSREKTIRSLKEIWGCKLPLIANSKTTFNGKIAHDITIMISDFTPVENDKKAINIQLTTELIKKNITNYKAFSYLKIITSNTSSDGERITASKVIKMTDL